MTASNSRLLVNVESPSGRHLVVLPGDARVEDLIPSLVEVCEGSSDPTGWRLVPMGEAALPGERTLNDCGVFAGAVLALVRPDELGNAEPRADAGSPAHAHARSLGVSSASDLAQLVRTRLQPSPRVPDIDRLSDSGYLRLLEAAIVAPQLGASTVVAVMSAHAGAGTTTVTFLLATLLSALRNDHVAAVDACPQSGALSHWMAPESGLPNETYRSLFEPPPTPEHVQEALVKLGRGLSILPAPSDHRSQPGADEPAWGRLIEHLRHLHNFVVLDCGAGFQRPISRAALGAADQVVLVTRSTPGQLDKLRSTIESIRGQGRTVVVIANEASERARAKRSPADVQQLALVNEPQPAARLKTRGFAWSDAPASWQESVRELAAVIVGSAQAKSG
jgi:MinD-like ATPase involved in chromosome partitioning or flagellar assembly